MSLKDKENRKVIYRNLAVVAVPIALQSLIASSLNLVDNLMVGAMGEEELAAVGAGMQIYFIAWIVTIGFSAGCSTFAAQFWGAGETGNIRKTTGFACTVCFSAGVIFFIAGFFFPEYVMRIFTNIPSTLTLGAIYVKYGAPCFLMIPVSICLQMALKATQQTKLPMYVSIIAFSMNTFMNWVLIFGHFGFPALGVKGAALATVASRTAELALCIFFVFIRSNPLSAGVGEFFGWSRRLVRKVIRNSLPTMANEALWSIATTMYVAAYARIGVTEYAAYQASDTIDRLFIMAAFSMGEAALIMVGQKLGEKKPEEAYELSKVILKISILLGLVLGVLLVICSKGLIALFNFTPEGQTDAFLILLVYGATMAVDVGTATIVTGILRSGGDTRFAMLADVGTIWFIGVPLAWAAAVLMRWPIYIAVLLARQEEVVKLIILMKRYLSKKWLNNVIGGL